MLLTLLDIVELLLVALLGSLPLIITHWADRRLQFAEPRPSLWVRLRDRLRMVRWRLMAARASLLITATEWVSTIAF